VKAFWKWLLLVTALLLVLPVGAEACSAPGTLDESDQPHALISADDELPQMLPQASEVPTTFMGSVGLPAASAILPDVTAGRCQVAAWGSFSGMAGCLRLHRRLCRELC